MKNKDFDGWNKEKKQLHEKLLGLFYHEREIWWCSLGVNVGYEQDGTGSNYDRPVLVVRGFSPHTFFGVALTGHKKEGKWYVYLGKIEEVDASVVLSQARTIDTRRLVRKMETLDEKTFEKVCVALQHTLFGRERA